MYRLDLSLKITDNSIMLGLPVTIIKYYFPAKEDQYRSII
jgi:hypothetical protein